MLLNLRDGRTALAAATRRRAGRRHPIPQGEGVLLVAEDGGLVVVPIASGATAGQSIAAPAEWVIAVPPENATGPTRVAVSADGKTVFTVTPVLVREEQKPIAKFVVRRVGGRPRRSRRERQRSADARRSAGGARRSPAPSAIRRIRAPSLAGQPTEPRHARRRSALGRRPPRSGSHLSHHAALRLRFPHGRWREEVDEVGLAAGGRWTPGGVTWELRERPAGPGGALAGDGGRQPARFLIADVPGVCGCSRPTAPASPSAGGGRAVGCRSVNRLRRSSLQTDAERSTACGRTRSRTGSSCVSIPNASCLCGRAGR